MKKIKVKYFPKSKSIHIPAESTKFYPLYLKYLFEYLRIPQNATIHFTDKTIIGGVETLLKMDEQSTLNKTKIKNKRN